MKEAKLILKNSDGLHARAAAQFIRKAIQFSSDISLVREGEEVDGKSIIGVMGMGIYPGDEFTIRAEGADEEEAITALVDFIEKDLNE